MQIVENWSRIIGTVQEWHPPDDSAGSGTIVIRVEDIGTVRQGKKSYPNLVARSAGEVVRVQVPNVDAHNLSLVEGMHIELQVRRGRSARSLFAKPGTVVTR